MDNKNIIQTNFIIANRNIIKLFGINTAVMLGELYGRYNYFRKRKQLKSGFFFATKESIEKSTKLTPYKQRKSTNVLESSGIIEAKHLDIPSKTYYKINEEKLLKVLKNSVVENIDDKRLKIWTTRCRKY